jgi:hypothetical protein
MYLQRTVSPPETSEIKAIESQQNSKMLGARMKIGTITLQGYSKRKTQWQATSYWSDCHTHPDLIVSLSLIVLAK